MEEKINLKQLEKHAEASIYQTGLVDISIGQVFLVSSLAMIFVDIRYYIYVLFLFPIIFLSYAIKYIAKPRMGVVKLKRDRIRKRKLFGITITLFLLMLISVTLFGDINKITDFMDIRWFISGIILLICVAVAYFTNFDRMYIYAFLIAWAFVLSEILKESPRFNIYGDYVYLVVSIILLVIGIVYLIRFLRKNPLPEA